MLCPWVIPSPSGVLESSAQPASCLITWSPLRSGWPGCTRHRGRDARAVRVVIESADGESAEICIEQPAELIEYPKPDE